MAGLSGFDLAAFVVASCERHGVPVKITDPWVHERVAVLLSGRPVRGQRQRDPAGSADSAPPHDINPVRVEAGATALTRCDHGMIDHGCDDRGLSGQVEIGPLSA